MYLTKMQVDAMDKKYMKNKEIQEKFENELNGLEQKITTMHFHHQTMRDALEIIANTHNGREGLIARTALWSVNKEVE